MTGIVMGGRMRQALQFILILLVLCTPSDGRPDSREPLLLCETPLHGKGRPPEFESEHRPRPLRRYRLVSAGLSRDTEAFVLHPDGTVTGAQITSERGGNTVSFKTPLGDGPMHGVHNLYIIEKRVVETRLVVRIAKWHTIHHSCGWGHGYKYDSDRIRAKTLDAIPLEISSRGLWDGNFHADVRSGDRLHFDARFFGVQMAGVSISLTSGRGWTKRLVTGPDGTAAFQLIRDYYPKRWDDFHSRHRERFVAVAEYEARQKGRFSGKDYDRILYISSIPWTYSPSRSDYTSYLAGLSIGFFVVSAGTVGIFVYRERRRKPYRGIVFSEKG